jgi:hypothetical protein
MQKQAIDLKAGDMVDLEGDPFVDQTEHGPSVQSEYAVVETIEIETADCVCVYFENFPTHGFPANHLFTIG